MVLDHAAIRGVRGLLNASDFCADANELIASSIFALDDHGAPIDVVSVASWLHERDVLRRAGGASYLGALVDAGPSTRDERFRAIYSMHRRAGRAHSVKRIL